MVSFGVQNMNRTFLITSKLLNMLGGTSFVVCFLLNTLFLLFFTVPAVIPLAAPILLHFKFEKHDSYFAFSFLATFDFFYSLFWGFLNNKYIHWTLLVSWKSPKAQLFPLCKHFNISKHQRHLVCVLLVSNYVLSTGFLSFNLKMHQPCLSWCHFHSKCTKPTLFLCW